MRGHIRRRLAKPNRQAPVSTRCRGLRSCQSGLTGGSTQRQSDSANALAPAVPIRYAIGTVGDPPQAAQDSARARRGFSQRHAAAEAVQALTAQNVTRVGAPPGICVSSVEAAQHPEMRRHENAFHSSVRLRRSMWTRIWHKIPATYRAIRSRWIGCCRGLRPPESGSRSRWLSSFISATASSLRNLCISPLQ